MGADSKIQWTHHTFNPWMGCTKVAPECANCYAEAQTARRGVKWGPSGTRIQTSEGYWKQPHAWNRAAEKAGERRRVFCASLADVFEDRRELIPMRVKLLEELIPSTPWLDWLILTKRTENLERFVPWYGVAPPHNVWLGTSIGTQARHDQVLHLLRCTAAIRFVSCEPMLEDVEFDPTLLSRPDTIDWIIFGGESIGRRECKIEWIRRGVAQCHEFGVAAFVKQLGSNATLNGQPYHTVDKKGGDPAEWPEDLRVREFPVA